MNFARIIQIFFIKHYNKIPRCYIKFTTQKMYMNSIDDTVNLAMFDQTVQLSDCINATYPNSPCSVFISLPVGIQALESNKKISPSL